MANWTLTGELGAGKSVLAVGRIRDHMLAGLPVAGNLDIYPEYFLPPDNRSTYIRLPDFPTKDDLVNLGIASDSKRENTFGLIVLDELAIFLNSRQWQSSGRDFLISFLRLIRKRHWHTLFIAQDLESLDKQARNGIVEHKVICKRTDRMSIPVFGALMRLFGMEGKLPQMHIGAVRYGKAEFSPLVETWRYWGQELYKAYNTDQHFSEDPERDIDLLGYEIAHDEKGKPYKKEKRFPASVVGMHSILSAWHLHGRYLTWWDRHGSRVKASFGIFAVLGLVSTFLFSGGHQLIQKATAPQLTQFDETFPQISGLMNVGADYFIKVDNQVLVVDSIKQEKTRTLYKANSQWYEQPLQP